MGLQVWLPLNGNLNNQGLSNVTTTNSGATIDNTGKIGKCYSFSGSNYITLPTTFLSDFTNEISVCAWINISSWNTQYDSILKMYASDAQWKNSIFAMGRNGTASRLYFSIANGTSSTQASCSLAEDQSLNTWYHIACVYNNTDKNMKIYLNGVLKTTYNTTIVPNFSSVTSVGVGGSPLASYGLKGKLNDVRIYNHALSEKEIKLLSQGLILHYPLDRNGWGQNNILSGTDFNGSSRKFTLTSGTEGGFTYTPTETITPSTTYTISCYMRGNANMNLYKICTGGNEAVSWVNRNEFSTEEYRKFTLTFSSPGSSKTLNQIYICTRYGSSNSQVGDWFEIKPYSLKMELGNVVTPWNPATSDTFATTIGFNSDIEYDISGYQNNGTRKNTFTYITNFPKYKLATIFNGSNNSIVAGQGAKVKDAITISCWGYMNSWSSYNGRLLSCTEGGGWNFEPSSGKMNFAIGTGTSGNTYKSVTSVTTLSQLGSGWHMFTGTYDGFNTKIYIDGVLENTNAAYTTKTPIYYLAANGIFVGAEAAGSATDPTGSYFNGYLSDVRIYATALSADDILELYNNKVI